MPDVRGKSDLVQQRAVSERQPLARMKDPSSGACSMEEAIL